MKLCRISPPYLCGKGKGSNILYIWIVHAVINWYKLSKNKVGGEILNKNMKDILAIVMKISHLPASAFNFHRNEDCFITETALILEIKEYNRQKTFAISGKYLYYFLST